jgi:hypothetical protein
MLQGIALLQRAQGRAARARTAQSDFNARMDALVTRDGLCKVQNRLDHLTFLGRLKLRLRKLGVFQ